MPSHRLLLRAGYVRQLGAGLYSLLPLGFRVNKRVEQVIREEMNAIGGQEMEMPVVHPAELWRESGRYDAIGPELVRFKDRGGPGHGPRDDPRGGRRRPAARHRPQLPPAADRCVYHFQTKFRDEPRVARRPDPRPRVRDEGRLQLRPRRGRARRRATGPITAPTRGSSSGSGSTRSPSAADVGMMGGSLAHEFMVLNAVRRGHARPVRGVRLRGEPADRADGRAPTPAAEDAAARSRTSRRPTRRRSTALAAFLGIPPSGPPRPRSS